MSGFIALHREAFDHHMLRDADRFRAWFWLVANAAWEPTRVRIKGETVTLERGELSFSVRFLADAWGWSKSRVDRFIADLRDEGMIETRSKNGTSAGHAAGQGQSIICICNYGKYQDPQTRGRDNDKAKSGTKSGQQRDNSGTNKNKGTREQEELPPNGGGKTDVLPLPLEPIEDDPDLITQAEVIEGWNTIAARHGLARIAKLTEARKRKLALQRKRFTVPEWVSVWAKIEQSPFLKGSNDRGWRCDFDFVLSEANFTKILEGKYDPQQTDRSHIRLAN